MFYLVCLDLLKIRLYRSAKRCDPIVVIAADAVVVVVTAENAVAAVVVAATLVALAVVGKVLPALAQRHGLGEIEAMLAACLADVVEEPRLLVRVHPTLVAPVRALVLAQAERRGFAGQIQVQDEPG